MIDTERARALAVLGTVQRDGDWPQVIVLTRSGKDQIGIVPKYVVQCSIGAREFGSSSLRFADRIRAIFVIGRTSGQERIQIQSCIERSGLPQPFYDPRNEHVSGILFSLTHSAPGRNGHTVTQMVRVRPKTRSVNGSSNGHSSTSLQQLVSVNVDDRVQDPKLQAEMVWAKLPAAVRQFVTLEQVRAMVSEQLPEFLEKTRKTTASVAIQHRLERARAEGGPNRVADGEVPRFKAVSRLADWLLTNNRLDEKTLSRLAEEQGLKLKSPELAVKYAFARAALEASEV